MNLGRLKPGDSVGFSAVTWSTNVMPLLELGLKPVPIDIELDTLNISSKTVRDVLKVYKLKAILVTNLLGFCGDLERIASLCKENGILLLEDTCESLGSKYKRKRLGNFGQASSFSFYVGHHMSTIEGGAVTTNDEELATMLRLVRAHGWDRNLSFVKQTQMRKKFQINSTFYSRYTFYDLGYNLRPTEITGFLGQRQLKYLDEIVDKRQKNFLKLAKVLYENNEKYFGIRFSHMDTVSNFAVPLICKNASIRDDLVKKCEGIVEIRPIVAGDITKQPFFTKHAHVSKNSCPNADIVHAQGLYFGNNPDLTKDEIQTLISTFA